MAWLQLTEDLLKSALNSVELELYNDHSTDVDVKQRLPGILDGVVAQVRGDIASCERNTLSVDSTLIPEEYHHHALAIARHRLLSTLPYCEITDARVEEYKDAKSFFNSVACCKRRPEPAADARKSTAPDPDEPGAEVFTSRKSIVGRRNLKGL